MEKTYLKYTKIRIGILILILIQITVIIVYIFNPDSSEASSNYGVWSSVNLPRQGDIGGWVLANDSDITQAVITEDNVIFCSVNNSGAPSRLFKSLDNGRTWRYTGGVTNDIVELSGPQGIPDILYYTDGTSVFKSINAGLSFQMLPQLPVDTTSGNLKIRSIDTVFSGSETLVIAGTWNSDVMQFGGVFIITDNGSSASWQDTLITGYDISAVAFSPEYQSDRTLMAVATDETDTFITVKRSDESWNQSFAPVVIPGVFPVYAGFAFPGDFEGLSGENSLYFGIDSGNGTGDVYRVNLHPVPGVSTAVDLDIGAAYGINNTDVSSLAVSATGLFAGAATSGQVYHSSDSGNTWTRSGKPPTGQSRVIILPDNGYAFNGVVYAGTSGQRSGFSRSNDGASTFNQISLIDSEITPGAVYDFAPSPNYSDDDTLFLLTLDFNSFENNVWRTTSGGLEWERILNSSLNDTFMKDISIPSDYDLLNRTVYLHSSSGGNGRLWISTDNGRTFSESVLPVEVDTWNVIDSATIYIGGCQGLDILVFYTDDGGNTWSQGTKVGNQSLCSVQLSPDFIHDSIMAVSNNFGWVYYSDDGGISYRPLPLDAVAPPFQGNVRIGFDNEFGINRTIYAVSDGAGEGIYRFVIGRSEAWEKLDKLLPSNARITAMALSEKGTLYAVNTAVVNNANGYGGIERALDPSAFTPAFETALNGLDDGIALNGLEISGDYLWSFDSTRDRLLMYHDVFTQPVLLISPASAFEITDLRKVKLEWEVLEGAAEYEWQLDYDGSFTSLPSGYSGCTQASSVLLTNLEPDNRYYWRVRATKPVVSPWSEIRNFAQSMSEEDNCPILKYPSSGAELSDNKPLFQWNAMSGIEKYDLMVAKDADFKSPVIIKTANTALSVNAWFSDTELDNGQIYYWKVRGAGKEGYTDWSALSAFRVKVTPVQEIQAQTVEPIDAKKTPDTPILLCPGISSSYVASKPLFQWEAITGAEGYELVISDESAFENPIILKEGKHVIPVSAWRCNVGLEPDTAYYWKVRAVFDDTFSEWSPISAFIVEANQGNPDNDTQTTSLRNTPGDSDPPVSGTGSGCPAWTIYVSLGLQVTTVLLMVTVLVVMILTRPRKPFQL